MEHNTVAETVSNASNSEDLHATVLYLSLVRAFASACFLPASAIIKLRSHSARSAANRRSRARPAADRAVSSSPRCQPRHAQSRQHAFCMERSHSAATDGNAVKVKNSSTLRAFPSVGARSAAVDGGRERKITYFLRRRWLSGERRIAADRATSGDSPLAAPLSSPLAVRCENAALVSDQLQSTIMKWYNC